MLHHQVTLTPVTKDNHGISSVKSLGIGGPPFVLGGIKTQPTLFESIGQNGITTLMSVNCGVLTLIS